MYQFREIDENLQNDHITHFNDLIFIILSKTVSFITNLGSSSLAVLAAIL